MRALVITVGTELLDVGDTRQKLVLATLPRAGNRAIPVDRLLEAIGGGRTAAD